MSEDLTIIDAVEHAFCPKFTYYQRVLCIKEHQERRGTILKGREIHSKKAFTNKNYLPVALPEGEKIIEKQYYSSKFNYVGKIDQAVLTPMEAVLIEVKYRTPFIGKTLLTQLGLQAILLEENLGKSCNTARVEFVKGTREIISVNITPEIKNAALNELAEIRKIIVTGEMPFSKYSGRCEDCSYRRICPVGTLKRDQ